VPSTPTPIAIVLTSFDPGGTEHQMTELARRIEAQGFEKVEYELLMGGVCALYAATRR